jgi:hypothetical protein
LADRIAMSARLLVGATLALLGCAGGARVDLPTAARADSTTAFRLYHGTEMVTVDHLRLSEDSVTGLRLREHPNAVQVTVAIPVSEVDSVKLSHPDREGLALFLVPVAIIGGFLLWMSTMTFD